MGARTGARFARRRLLVDSVSGRRARSGLSERGPHRKTRRIGARREVGGARREAGELTVPDRRDFTDDDTRVPGGRDGVGGL